MKVEIEWHEFDKRNVLTHPNKQGRYLIYRPKCDKTHFEVFNGIGWSSTNNEPLFWASVKTPKDWKLENELYFKD